MSIPSTEYAHAVGTNEGYELLADDPGLAAMVDAFLQSPHTPEKTFNHLPLIGSARNSIVRRYGDLAIKLSTPTTGKNPNKTAAESLIQQHLFLRALNAHLKHTPDICAPEQHIALRGHENSFISIQQYMEGWQPLKKWVWAANTEDDFAQLEHTMRRLQKRIKAAVRNPFLRLGLNDIGLYLGPYVVNAGNILVEPGADNPDDANLCLIDQPCYGITADWAIRGLRATRKIT